jgi:hypothetical protein
MESIDLSRLLSQVPYLDDVVRAFSLTGSPKTLRTGKGPLLPVYEGLPQLTPLVSLGQAPGLAVCGSVSTLAFSLAQRLGCSPIVLVGQDLAYTDGLAYATGTPYEGSRVNVSADGESLEHERSATLLATNGKLTAKEPLQRVAAWGGHGTVPSTIGFSAVRSWLELAADVLAHECPEQRVINATEGGARVEGFEESTLADVLAPLPELNISPQSIADAAHAARPPLSRAQLRLWLENQLSGARAARHAARRVRRLALAADRSVNGEDPRSITLAFRKLESAESELRMRVGECPFVDGYSWTGVDAAMQEATHEDDETRASAQRAVRTEARVALAIESCTRELEAKLAQLIKNFGAAAP